MRAGAIGRFGTTRIYYLFIKTNLQKRHYENKTVVIPQRAPRVPVSIHIDTRAKRPTIADALEIRTLVLNRKLNNQPQWQG